MPNIFGKNPGDYTHLVDQFTDAAALGRFGDSRPVFRGLDSIRALTRFGDTEIVTQGVGVITNSMEAIQAEIEEIMYLDFRVDKFLPIKTNIPEGAQSYAYRVIDRHGRGKFISRDGTDAGNATVTLGHVPYAIGYGGIMAQWTLEDLRAAIYGGVGLDTETITAAINGCLDHIEDVAISGDTSYGFAGITNLTGPTTVNSAKLISAMTGDELVAFIQAQVSALIEASNTILPRQIGRKLAVYLPTTQYNTVSTLPYGDNRDKTAWEFVRFQNPWTVRTGVALELREVVELDGAGAGATDRMILGFPEESRIWEMALPISPRVISVNPRGFTIEAPVEYKVSGVNLKRPAGVRYVDSI